MLSSGRSQVPVSIPVCSPVSLSNTQCLLPADSVLCMLCFARYALHALHAVPQALCVHNPSRHAVHAAVAACCACCALPDSVNSRPAACESLPTKALARRKARESMGPEGGTPMCHSFVLPGQSCMTPDCMCLKKSKNTVQGAESADFTCLTFCRPGTKLTGVQPNQDSKASDSRRAQLLKAACRQAGPQSDRPTQETGSWNQLVCITCTVVFMPGSSTSIP